MELRELTRAAETARETLLAHEYETESLGLRDLQVGLRERTAAVIDRLDELQREEGKNYAKDMDRLGRARLAMVDAAELLGMPATDGPTIAAETEAIEALLETKRGGKGGGGGGGSTPGGSNAQGGTDRLATALARLGEGKASEAREVDQISGSVGSEFPEEFRRGLDAYFEALEDAAPR